MRVHQNSEEARIVLYFWWRVWISCIPNSEQGFLSAPVELHESSHCLQQTAIMIYIFYYWYSLMPRAFIYYNSFLEIICRSLVKLNCTLGDESLQDLFKRENVIGGGCVQKHLQSGLTLRIPEQLLNKVSFLTDEQSFPYVNELIYLI